MQSPTAIRPSRLMAPPWIMLRTITPKPSLLALTVIPMEKEKHMLNTWLSLLFYKNKNKNKQMRPNQTYKLSAYQRKP